MRILTEDDYEKLRDHNWVVICENPLEIVEGGRCLAESGANGYAAEYIIRNVLNEW